MSIQVPIVEFLNYKEFILKLIESLPNGGRGTFAKLSKHLNVSSVSISQIFKGSKDLSSDQALLVSEFFDFNEIETEYFITLVQIERASTHKLKKYLEHKLEEIREKSFKLSKRIKETKVLSDLEKSVYYSDWLYSGIRVVCSLPEIRNVDDLVEYFGVDKEVIQQRLSFLLQNGILKEVDGELKTGNISTHIKDTDPRVNLHRKNWRLKAVDKIVRPDIEDMFFSAPMVISEDYAATFREKLVAVISDLYKEVPACESEVAYCFNIDFFKF